MMTLETRRECLRNWIDVIRELFPANTKFEQNATNTGTVQVIRILAREGDSVPRTRVIFLKVAEEALSGYASSDKAKKARGDRRLRNLVEHKLKELDVKNGDPVEWLVKSDFLNGHVHTVFD